MKLLGAALVLTLLITAIPGCTGDRTAESDIPDSLLVGVLVDVYSTTARAHLNGTDASLARVEAMARFNLDTMALNRTLEYFAANPDSAIPIYQQALDSLIIVQRDLRAPPELDSLAKHIRGSVRR